MKQSVKPKAFNDGLCEVYEVTQRTLSKLLGVFNYCEETVGIVAFTELNAIGTQVDMVISIPFNKIIKNGYVIKIGEEYYVIKLIQIKDTFPKSLRITLSGMPIGWKK